MISDSILDNFARNSTDEQLVKPMAKELLAAREVVKNSRVFMDKYGDDPYSGLNLVAHDNPLKVSLENYDRVVKGGSKAGESEGDE